VLPKLQVLLNLDANSTNVKKMEELYTARDPSDEYFYYAAADQQSLYEQAGKSLINLNAIGVNFEANVTYEPVIKDIVLSDIEFFRANPGDEWDMIEPIVESRNADEVLRILKAPNGLRVPATIEDNSLSYVEFFSFPGDASSGFFFRYQKIIETQVLTTTGYSVDPDVSVGDVYEHWQGLVEKYQKVPLQSFDSLPR